MKLKEKSYGTVTRTRVELTKASTIRMVLVAALTALVAGSMSLKGIAKEEAQPVPHMVSARKHPARSGSACGGQEAPRVAPKTAGDASLTGAESIQDVIRSSIQGGAQIGIQGAIRMDLASCNAQFQQCIANGTDQEYCINQFYLCNKRVTTSCKRHKKPQQAREKIFVPTFERML